MAAVRARDTVLTEFLAEVRAFNEMVGELNEADDLRRLHRDRARYWRTVVQAGRAEQNDLWREAEAWCRAENVYRNARTAYDTAQETMARRFGGEEWLRLRDLLAAIANSNAP